MSANVTYVKLLAEFALRFARNPFSGLQLLSDRPPQLVARRCWIALLTRFRVNDNSQRAYFFQGQKHALLHLTPPRFVVRNPLVVLEPPETPCNTNQPVSPPQKPTAI
jgi:hypothetical protein